VDHHRAGTVGRDGERHLGDRLGDAACGITVVAGLRVLARTAPVRFLGSAGVDYDGARLAVGLSAAAVLAAIAALLLRTTDWRQVGLPSTTDDA
jgi:hypothetical protein